MRRLAVVLTFPVILGYANADTENVRQWQSQMQFRPVAGGNASGGSTARRPPPTPSEKSDLFRALDFDGDGFVSKAEAAGHEKVTVGFDRADRNRDGKLSFAEYDRIGKPAAKKAGKKRPQLAKKSD